MEFEQIIALLFRWLHIIPAMIIVGGTLFLRLSVVPAAIEVGQADDFREAMRKRWAKLVMIIRLVPANLRVLQLLPESRELQDGRRLSRLDRLEDSLSLRRFLPDRRRVWQKSKRDQIPSKGSVLVERRPGNDVDDRHDRRLFPNLSHS